ncbi:hypothetical protein MABM_30150 [Mycobacteroides abscessus]|nr:hypothetical protein MABM_30150 [Mycobacteroides abscessus]
MTDIEPPLTHMERLALVSLYTRLAVSQNRSVAARLDSEAPCYADLNISNPETLSHKVIPAIRPREGFKTEEAC